jgi:hypothetical protein
VLDTKLLQVDKCDEFKASPNKGADPQHIIRTHELDGPLVRLLVIEKDAITDENVNEIVVSTWVEAPSAAISPASYIR